MRGDNFFFFYSTKRKIQHNKSIAGGSASSKETQIVFVPCLLPYCTRLYGLKSICCRVHLHVQMTKVPTIPWMSSRRLRVTMMEDQSFSLAIRVATKVPLASAWAKEEKSSSTRTKLKGIAHRCLQHLQGNFLSGPRQHQYK